MNECTVREYVQQAVVDPLKRVTREVATLYAFAAIGVAVCAFTGALFVARRFTDND